MSYVCRLTWFLMLFCSSSLLLAQEPLMWGEGRWGLNAWSQDSDYDGVADPRDTFPLDAAASVDTDGDGMPDEWNLGCDVACQDASGLVLDDDDDGDGVLDISDAYPLTSLGGLTDTDGDGRPDDCDSACLATGMAADIDDDGDGYTDQYEIEMGSDPLDPSDMPRSGGLSPALLRVISQEVVKDNGG